MTKDYRDLLHALFEELHNTQGLTHHRLSKQTGVSEQAIAEVFSKQRNLSAPSLERVLRGLGYAMRFEPEIPLVATGSSPRAPELLARSTSPASSRSAPSRN